MEKNLKVPDPLPETGNMAKNWQKWKEDFIMYMKRNNSLTSKKDLEQVLILRSCMGNVARDAFKVIKYNANEKIDIVFQRLDEYFNSFTNIHEERYKFFSRSKRNNETFEDYIKDLKEKVGTCNFGDMTDSLIIDRVILETKSDTLRQQLFETNNLDLLTLIAICNTYQYLNYAQNNINNVDTTNNTNTNNKKYSNHTNVVNLDKQNQPVYRKVNKRTCWKCGQNHPRNSCPAWGVKCEKCGQFNHFTHHCRKNNGTDREAKKKLQVQNSTGRNVHVHNSVNMQPSAPPPSDVGNTLYPNLNDSKFLQGQSSSNQWSWTHENRNKTNESIQKSEALSPMTVQTKATTLKKEFKSSKNDDSCNIS